MSGCRMNLLFSRNFDPPCAARKEAMSVQCWYKMPVARSMPVVCERRTVRGSQCGV